MATVKHAINKNDVVALVGSVGRWPVGTKGTVVSDYGDVKLVEISNEQGEMLELIQAPIGALELISKHSR